jgi:hypothetical protein
MRQTDRRETVNMQEEKRFLKVPTALVRSWFELTADEQTAALTIVCILLLGITVKLWHTHRRMESADSHANAVTQYVDSHRTANGGVNNEH